MRTWNSVIVGVDPEPESVRAAELGWKIAQAASVPCRLVHVVYDMVAGFGGIGTPPTMRQLVVLDARRRLAAGMRGLVPDSVLDSMEVHVGRPSGTLVHLASPADMLVLGGKRHGRMERWLAGGTAAKVAPDARGPMLVAHDYQRPARVLAAVDLSSAAEGVIAEAERLAGLFGAHLGVLHVIEPIIAAITPLGPGGFTLEPTMTDDDWYRARHETWERAIMPLVRTPSAEFLERRGEVIPTIRATAMRWNADVLVTGSHGKGWTERVLLGSTTLSLLEDMPCSVLVAPGRRAAPLKQAAIAGTPALAFA